MDIQISVGRGNGRDSMSGLSGDRNMNNQDGGEDAERDCLVGSISG